MQTSYKEIFYGIAFGLGAAALDTVIDAHAAGESFFAGLADHPGMLLYRLLFVVYGVLIGWLLWKNNQRERDMRRLVEEIRHFHQEYEAQAVVLHTNLQLLLTKGLSLPADAESLLRTTYEKSRALESLIRRRPSL
jgi:H+/Cl- antiporter ClcA